jgi:hypothetical protein
MAFSILTLGGAASVAILAALTPLSASADGLEAPTGDVLLSVRGAIAHHNEGDTALFDREMLEALGSESFETTTIWTEGVQSFTGVPLHALIDAVGADGETLRAIALNDYAVEIPVSDAEERGGPIVAYLQNGEPMSVREKGPLWIVYPYDARTTYQTEQIYARSIWQLVSLEVLP